MKLPSPIILEMKLAPGGILHGLDISLYVFEHGSHWDLSLALRKGQQYK